MWCEVGVQIHPFLYVAIQRSQIDLLKRVFFLPSNVLVTLVSNQLAINT